MASNGQQRRGVAVTARIDYVSKSTSPPSRAGEPLKARVRVANGPATVSRARVVQPDDPPRVAVLPKSNSSTTITAFSAADGTVGRARTRSADPESSKSPSSWETISPPPVPAIPAAHRADSTPVVLTARKVHSGSPRSISPARSAPTPDVLRNKKSPPRGKGKEAVVSHLQSPPAFLMPAVGPVTPPALSPSVSSESAASSSVARTQPVTTHVTVRHQRRRSSSISLLSNSISSASQESVSERLEAEKEAWLAAKREEDEERDARVKRKIMDLEITNASLLAINQTLERNKLKQTAEIRDLRHGLSSGLSTPGLVPPAGSGILSEDGRSEEDDWESLMAEDPAFAGILASVDELIKQAQRACAFKVEAPRDAPRVLNPQLLEPPEADIGGSSSEEEDLSASMASLDPPANVSR